MAKAKSVMAFIAMVALISAADVAAQSPDCDALLQTLIPCIGFVAGTDPKPSGECCTALGNVVKTNPSCLCEVLNGNTGGFKINMTKVSELSQDCKVQTPPISSCYAGAPEPSPNPFEWPLPGSPAPPPPENAGEMFAPSMVAIFSLVALLLMKILS
ncbi:non-specific lipid transfer protein GPI-anchored 29-like [Cryptomeria japonica]|uniref:non-specific lipid transfer protein GPI-anchored 29-like n=1 Tax=Cryptomeria japonica TaxID=3369 RepID=UPI0025ACFBBB|nr:non-specific lipid transfer protein GPI-anchored 29-like [Cryptomeria japonica]